MTIKSEVRIMDEAAIKRVLLKISHEILARNKGPKKLALVGLQTRGVFVARRIAEMIESIEKTPINVGVLDVTMYRDDFRAKMKQPSVKVTTIPFDVDGTSIVLVDDVLYTGRTIRAALDAIMDFGRPRKIQLAVLIDRGHRELPLAADFIGETIKTQPHQEIRVRMKELDEDGRDEVTLVTLADEEED